MEENPTYEELRSANEQLRQKLEWLEGIYHDHRDAGQQVKSRFLSNISHEIRTPMNAILGFSDLLNRATLTESEKDEYIQYITHNSQALLKVMDNIIDLSLIENNCLTMKQEEVFIEELFEGIYNTYKSKCIQSENYRMSLVMSTPGLYGRLTVKVDGYRLRRIIENLINTAIIHQLEGEIEMKMDIKNEKCVKISIISNKIELLEERANMVFENNGNRDDWHNHNDSTGLAFKLAREMVEAMGGSVYLDQVSDRKLAICIELPIENIGIIKKNGSNREVTALLN
jgi:signal transduction histidine kinase